MSIFPDCRNDETYNTDFLNEYNLQFISGMDYALLQLVNLFENNLECYESELSEVLPDGYICPEDEIFASREDLFEIIYENKRLLSSILLNWLEMERNEIITSMIDDMDKDEYQILKTAAIEKNGIDKYYDTRKSAVNGKH